MGVLWLTGSKGGKNARKAIFKKLEKTPRPQPKNKKKKKKKKKNWVENESNPERKGNRGISSKSGRGS